MDVAKLAADLKSSDAAARASAAEQLAHLADGAKGAAVPLVEAMNDADPSVRDWVFAALESLGPPAPQDAAALAKLLANDNLDVGYWAATLLGRLGADYGSACTDSIQPLITALESHPESAVRERAAWALGQIGPPAKNAVPALQSAASSNSARLARLSKDAVDKINAG